ncbi:MAG TPA: ABC transporter substrate-binding protein [Ktedonobacterales bacterium]|nr:ABC transporter substrate-binding protein [Ktedonobacterales bacterium]
MHSRSARIRWIMLIIVVLAAAGFLLSKVDWYGTKHLYCTGDCAYDETLRAVLPASESGRSPDVATLDPARALGDTNSMIVVGQLFDGLVTLDKNLSIEPWGARSWTISPDGLTYTFTLTANQQFSEGAPLHASDYAWSLNRSIDPCFGESSSAVYWALIKDASAFHAESCRDGHADGAIMTLVGRSITPDDKTNTLTITLARPAGYFLATLAYPWAFVVERRVVAGQNIGKDGRWLDHLGDGQTGQGGSGMFYLSKWDHNGVLVVKPNPNWWGAKYGMKPNFTEVDYTFVGASGASGASFDAFKADAAQSFTNMLPDSPSAPVSSLAKYSYYHEQSALNMIWLTFDQRKAPFDDLNARKAFCLAINREYLNQRVYQHTVISSWHLIPQSMPGFNVALEGVDGALLTGDTLLAQQYWRNYLAAHGARAPALTLYAPSRDSDGGQMMTTLRDLWRETLGVSIGLAASPSSANVTPIAVRPDYPDPQAFMSQAVAPGGQRVSVPGADALLRRADALAETSQRLPLYQQAEQLLIDNVAVCPLFQSVNYYAMRTRLRAFTEDGRGLIPNDAWLRGYIARVQ